MNADQIIATVASDVAQYHDPLERLAREVGQLRGHIRRLAPPSFSTELPAGSFYCDACIDGLGDCVVFYDYTAGRPGVHTMPNGDPGYPDDPAELYVTVIQIAGCEFDFEVFSDYVKNKLEAAAQADVERRYEGAQAEQYYGRDFA